MGDCVEANHKNLSFLLICRCGLEFVSTSGLKINLFYTWYISALTDTILGFFQIETITYVLSKGHEK